MRRVLAALAAVTVMVLVLPGLAAAGTRPGDPRYGLVHGCYALQAPGGAFVTRTTAGYAATATYTASAEAFRMQATALGRYMLYDRSRHFPGVTALGLGVVSQPGPATDFVVDSAPGGTFTLVSRQTRQGVGVGPGGRLVLGGSPAHFAFVSSQGCPAYPEAEIDASGPVYKPPEPWASAQGFIDAHMHMMGFEFLGGNVHCGRPWSPYGVTVALAGCPTEAENPVVELVLNGGSGKQLRDPRGWPTFHDWPSWDSLAHEQSYYRWVERAWRGGLRIFVNLFVENHALCTLMPHRRNPCNEMDSVRLQARDLHALQDYIDAQSGGPGKGWFRIVSDPFQARRVINSGKLAVVPGIEVSNLFDCGLKNGSTSCTNPEVDQRLAEAYNRLGVRDMELINKFDNGFGGVAGDAGSTGVAVNTGNRYETGRFWDMQTCTGPAEQSDKQQLTVPGGSARDQVFAAFRPLLPPGTLPLYPSPPHCNTRGLSSLGAHLVRQMIARRMIIDPDHLDVVSRKALLDIVEAKHYSGVVSSHSWSTADAYPRIYHAGGVVTPYAGDSAEFVAQWRVLRAERDKRFHWGIGWGADMNGFGHQGAPRHGPHPVKYPFKSADGLVTFHRQRTGNRTFDINADGVAHYGLYPDWVQDLRMQAGNRIVRDLQQGPEAYLEMWERAVGVRSIDACRGRHMRFRRGGLRSLRLRAPAEEVLRGAGQPVRRGAKVWSWCVRGTHRRVRGLFTRGGRLELVWSSVRGDRARGLHRGSRVPSGARRVRRGVYRWHRRFVVVARHHRVRAVGVVAHPSRLRRDARRARL